VVVIHGGCWLQSVATLDYLSPLAEALTDAGWASYNLEYRSTDSSGGGWPGTFEDIAAAIDFTPMLAATYNLDLSRLAVVGHSAGGHLALWAASRNQLPAQSVLYRPQPVVPATAVGLAAITDLANYPQQNPSCGRPIAALVGQQPATPERLAETSPLATTAKPLPNVSEDEYWKSRATAGRPMCGVEIRIVDDAGASENAAAA
jgi:acetyl esterase/lipase